MPKSETVDLVVDHELQGVTPEMHACMLWDKTVELLELTVPRARVWQNVNVLVLLANGKELWY
jgi:hypothetical protein